MQHPDYVICQIDCKGARLKKQQQQDPNCLEPFVVEQQQEHNCIEPYVVEQRVVEQQAEEANCIEPFIVEQEEKEPDRIEQLLVEQQHEQYNCLQQYVVEHQTEVGNCLEQHVVEHQAEEEQQKVDGIMTEPVTDFYFDIDNIDVDVLEANDFLFAKEIDPVTIKQCSVIHVMASIAHPQP